MAYALVFRDHDKTLEESEISGNEENFKWSGRTWNRVEKLMLLYIKDTV